MIHRFLSHPDKDGCVGTRKWDGSEGYVQKLKTYF